MNSKIEAMILDRAFDYLQPYFYNNPYALRCELGIGDTKEAYMSQARKGPWEYTRYYSPARLTRSFLINGFMTGRTAEAPK